ncbi:MAG: CfrBI family restriction endonuclease [Phycisphaerales bacterium]|nr:CfrBI family restriction endonuclease [Phycisphaerales bacterium]
MRTQTEPLTRQRIAEIGGALVGMFERGLRQDPHFYTTLSERAVELLGTRGITRDQQWPAQWVLGLTGKGVQNVLRGDQQSLRAFLTTLDRAIAQAADNLHRELGPLHLSIGLGKHGPNSPPPLGWGEALRLTTALGCAELAVRGSDKSRYGKLFERLVLGSVLSILGFNMDDARAGARRNRVFWLSDSTDDRECDATAIIQPGRLARFDIGFIGIGNPEIVRDKLSRFAREVEHAGRRSSSTTFVIVDRYPTGPSANSIRIAEQSGAALIQMSMSLWPRELARELKERLGHPCPLTNLADGEAESHIRKSMSELDVLSFLGKDEDPEQENGDED